MQMNRRNFLKTSGILAAGLFAVPSFSYAEDSVFDPNSVVLLADTHCGTKTKHQVEFMKRSVREIAAFRPLPKQVLIYGDFAFLFGRKEDYLVLKELVKPLDDAGIVWTTCMGNHDRRDNFAEVFPEHAAQSLRKDRLVFKVETPHADFLLLDSLIQSEDVNKWITPGEIGPDQKEWLDAFLAKQTKPVFVGAHHSLDETKIADVLKKHACCAGYINGHHHYWKQYVYDGADALILPSNGHWGDIGYTTVRVEPNRAEFKLVMKDFVLPNRTPDYQPNPAREANIAKKRDAHWIRTF